MRVIALTGRIGSGKSTIASDLRTRGAATIDADAIVHDLYRDDPVVRGALRDRFGPEVVRPDGVDRARLASLVFADGAALRDLEALVHPRVRARASAFLDQARAEGTEVAVIEAVKIVESGGADACDELWIAWCDDETAVARLRHRGMAPDIARARLATQGTPASWIDRFTAGSARIGRPRAACVIDNSGTPERTLAQVEAFSADLAPLSRVSGGGAGGGGLRRRTSPPSPA